MKKGEKFSVVYLNTGEPIKDSSTFRIRLAAKLISIIQHYSSKGIHLNNNIYALAKHLETEAGAQFGGSTASLKRFFHNCDLIILLNCITECINFFHQKGRPESAIELHEFIERILIEEHLGYRLDDCGGVHYFVDKEFENNRESTLAILQGDQFNNARQSYQSAYNNLDAETPDKKSAIRNLFETAEILTKQLVDTKNLNGYVCRKELAPLITASLSSDETESEVFSHLMESCADWVEANHLYRHGQKAEEAVEPSDETLIYIMSTGSALVRLLAQVILKKNSPH